jgi:hypothetical protein
LKILKKKKIICLDGLWSLLRCLCSRFSSDERNKMTSQAPCLPILATANFFLFWKVKEELAGLCLTQESFKSALVGDNVLHR